MRQRDKQKGSVVNFQNKTDTGNIMNDMLSVSDVYLREFSDMFFGFAFECNLCLSCAICSSTVLVSSTM